MPPSPVAPCCSLLSWFHAVIGGYLRPLCGPQRAGWESPSSPTEARSSGSVSQCLSCSRPDGILPLDGCEEGMGRSPWLPFLKPMLLLSHLAAHELSVFPGSLQPLDSPKESLFFPIFLELLFSASNDQWGPKRPEDPVWVSQPVYCSLTVASIPGPRSHLRLACGTYPAMSPNPGPCLRVWQQDLCVLLCPSSLNTLQE